MVELDSKILSVVMIRYSCSEITLIVTIEAYLIFRRYKLTIIIILAGKIWDIPRNILSYIKVI